MRRWWPVLCVLGATFPAARWWYEQVRYASEQHAELWAAGGVLALLLLRARAPAAPRSLLPCAFALGAYALCWGLSSPLLGCAAAALALACALSRACLDSALRIELAALALACVPVVPLLQFQIGHALRELTAGLATLMLAAGGAEVEALGTGLLIDGRAVWVDEPCSGLRGLWAGVVTAAASALVLRLPAGRTLLVLALVLPACSASNALRAASLALCETGADSMPAWVHPGIGLLVEGAALLAIALAAQRCSGGTRCAR
jgi:exosortase/archaeosortase family protein